MTSSSSFSDLLDRLDDDERAALRDIDGIPEWIDPMLAVLSHDHFDDPDWIYERKLDGERALAFVEKPGRVRLRSRNRQQLEDTYPELVDALAEAVERPCVLDGEIVAFEGDVTSFARLQQRLGIGDPEEARASGVAVYYYLFDLPVLDGHDLSDVPLRRRKQILRDAVRFQDPLRFTTHRNGAGLAYHEEACRRGWEGIIAKRASSPYRHARSRDWLKFKCSAREEFVVVGFTEPEGERPGFGALVLGTREQRDGPLRSAGRVGTGFDHDLLRELRGRLDRRRRATCPLEADDDPARDDEDIRWVRPDLVAEVAFTEWTEAGSLRHPRFIGLRADKSADEVVRETPSDGGAS